MDKKFYVPHVVIIGAGFGGLRAARALKNKPVKVTLIDRNNYHLFQPLLYQVATAGLSSDEIAYPIRGIIRKQKNLNFLMQEVLSIDFETRKVILKDGHIEYDFLILAAGSETNFFNLDSLGKNRFGLKNLSEAQAIRNHILLQYEKAMIEKDEEIRNSRLTFVIVGGGPTGVEMAGAVAELVRLARKDFPELDHEVVQVILLEAIDRLLAHLSSSSSTITKKALEKKGVKVKLNAMVASFDGKVIHLQNDNPIQTHTLIWAAGVQAASLIRNLDLEKTSQNRIKILPTLQLPQDGQVFVIGDAAYLQDEFGQPLPMVAPVAMQQADLAINNLMSILQNKPLIPFRYKDYGSMATIGRNQAVAELFKLRLHGWIAWLVWLFVHLMQLVGFRNRLVVLINWAWQYLFYDRAVRLIERSE